MVYNNQDAVRVILYNLECHTIISEDADSGTLQICLKCNGNVVCVSLKTAMITFEPCM